MVTIEDLTHRPHSYRNYDPQEFVDALEAGEDSAGLRSALNRIESARLEPLLENTSSMFARLDRDEQETFTRRNAGLVRWMSVYNRLNDFDPSVEFYDLGGDALNQDLPAPLFHRSDVREGRTLLQDLARRRSDYREFTPSEFGEIARQEHELKQGLAQTIGLRTPEIRENIDWPKAFSGREVVRDLLLRIEDGRFEPVLDKGHVFFSPLDPDERRIFAQHNPGITTWLSVWGQSQDLIFGDQLFPFDKMDFPPLEETASDVTSPPLDVESPPLNVSDEESRTRPAAEFREALEDVVGDVGDLSMTQHGDLWTFDFRLPVAVGAPFKSSGEYDESEDVITGVALRFSMGLLDRYPDDRLKQRLDALIDRTNPPGGTIWTAYIRGDAQVTGPHITAPGDFSEIDAAEFVDWLPRLLSEYREVFGEQRDAGGPDLYSNEGREPPMADIEPEVVLTHESPGSEYRNEIAEEIERLDFLGLLDGLELITDDPDIYPGTLADQHSGRYDAESDSLYISPDEFLGPVLWHELAHHRIREENPGMDFEAGQGETYWGETTWTRFAVEEFMGWEWDTSQDPMSRRKARHELYDRIEDTVSDYAAFGPMEFVGEVFSGRLAGAQYPEWVDDLYDRLHGPETGTGPDYTGPEYSMKEGPEYSMKEPGDTEVTVSDFRLKIREQLARSVIQDVLDLAQQGEVMVERLSEPGGPQTRLDTPEGEVTLPRYADEIDRQGEVFTRTWNMEPLQVHYTTDWSSGSPRETLRVETG